MRKIQGRQDDAPTGGKTRMMTPRMTRETADRPGSENTRTRFVSYARVAGLTLKL